MIRHGRVLALRVERGMAGIGGLTIAALAGTNFAKSPPPHRLIGRGWRR